MHLVYITYVPANVSRTVSNCEAIMRVYHKEILSQYRRAVLDIRIIFSYICIEKPGKYRDGVLFPNIHPPCYTPPEIVKTILFLEVKVDLHI